jgi:hypothetical protein
MDANHSRHSLMHKMRLRNVVENKMSKKNLNQINRKNMEIINANKFYSKNKYK